MDTEGWGRISTRNRAKGFQEAQRIIYVSQKLGEKSTPGCGEHGQGREAKDPELGGGA